MISSLSQRVIRGFIRLQLVLAILLFLPAGSIRFWEAWLYWGLFGGSVLFITRYFLKVDPDFVERRMQIGPGAEPSKTQQVVQFMSGVLACALFLAAGLEHRLRGSDLPASIVLVADGLLVFCMGITFRVFHTNRYAAGTVRVEVNQQVVSNGPYATVRHPYMSQASLGFWRHLSPLARFGHSRSASCSVPSWWSDSWMRNGFCWNTWRGMTTTVGM